MNSSIIGYFPLADLFERSAPTILSFAGDNDHYDEFKIGDWKTFVFRNASGEDEDGFVGGAQSGTRLTPRGRQLPELNAWIEATFRLDLLRLARIHSLGDGVLIPHRDFVEFLDEKPAWTRIHIPIMTNDQCLHAEEDTVFRMRLGEVWHFDASRLHSATNFSAQRRLNLCLDFELGDLPLSAIFQYAGDARGDIAPEIVERPPLTHRFERGILCLSQVLNDYSYRQVVGLLSRIPFYVDVSLEQVFEWLNRIARDSGDEALHAKSTDFSRFLRVERGMQERFAL